MALPIEFEGQTTKFVAEGCGDLPAAVEATSHGTRITSAWQLSPEELAAVNESGGVVFLSVYGVQPPVSVSGICPVQF